jgi:hypothetical protein
MFVHLLGARSRLALHGGSLQLPPAVTNRIGTFFLDEFWGIRDVYAAVKFISRALKAEGAELTPALVLEAVLRNFGGIPIRMAGVLSVFSRQLGLSGAADAGVSTDDVKYGTVALIQQSVADPAARSLLILTKNNEALPMLLDETTGGFLARENTEVIFSSDFPQDSGAPPALHRLYECMEQGKTVVLVQCEAVLGSLCHLLNQRYIEFDGVSYARTDRLHPLHTSFRLIVVADRAHAYTELAPALLSRFEKQVLERQYTLAPEHKQVAAELQRFVRCFCTPIEEVAAVGPEGGAEGSRTELRAAKKPRGGAGVCPPAFCGYHADLLSSLAVLMCREHGEQYAVQAAIIQLLWVATPEAVCCALADGRNALLDSEFGLDLRNVYFDRQRHSSLSDLASMLDSADGWAMGTAGTVSQVLTYSPLSPRAGSTLERSRACKGQVTTIVLHGLASECDLTNAVGGFFADSPTGSLLLVQCGLPAASARRIEHAKFLCEKAHASHRAAPGGRSLHAMVLLHLPPGGVHHAVEFSSKWDSELLYTAFVDSTE